MRSLTTPWELGGHTIANRVVLAPLAGIGNWFVRLQAKRYGAGLVVSEMVSSFGLKYGDERTHREFLRIHPGGASGLGPALRPRRRGDAHRRRDGRRVGRGHDRPQLRLPGAQGVQDGRRRGAARRPGQGRRHRARGGRGQRPARHGEAALRQPARRAQRRRAGAPARGRGGRRGHRLPSPARLPAALGRARLRARRPSSCGALDVPVVLSGGLRDEERTLAAFERSGADGGDARPRLAGQPLALRAPARPARLGADDSRDRPTSCSGSSTAPRSTSAWSAPAAICASSIPGTRTRWGSRRRAQQAARHARRRPPTRAGRAEPPLPRAAEARIAA